MIKISPIKNKQTKTMINVSQKKNMQKQLQLKNKQKWNDKSFPPHRTNRSLPSSNWLEAAEDSEEKGDEIDLPHTCESNLNSN